MMFTQIGVDHVKQLLACFVDLKNEIGDEAQSSYEKGMATLVQV